MKKLFIDTANLESIIAFNNKGIISGVTTNPSLISKEPKQNFDKLIEEIWHYCATNKLSFSVEVFTIDPKEIIDQAIVLNNKLLSISNNPGLLYIKIPIGISEINCIKTLSDRFININCTCCYTATQMQLAAMAGAKYVSLFFNRTRDMKEDPILAIKRTRKFIDDNGLSTEIIAGSIRNGVDIQDAWDAGSDIVTCGVSSIENALSHDGTTKSINGFMNDFNNWIGK